MRKYVLASASPRRQELLKLVVEPFECHPADLKEILPPDLPAEDGPAYLARQKAEAVSRLYPTAVVIGADTSVILDGHVFGKPQNAEDAIRMLSALSGRHHQVVTGCYLCCNGQGVGFSQTTDVEFYPLNQEEIKGYLKTNEPMDKAGAYGIQGYGALLVRGIEGDYFNVMGLPVAELSRHLSAFESTLENG